MAIDDLILYDATGRFVDFGDSSVSEPRSQSCLQRSVVRQLEIQRRLQLLLDRRTTSL